MSTFAKAGFNAAKYLAARPVYPKALYDNVFSFHRGPTAVALDLGAGSGQVTQMLAERVTDTVYAVDPSEGMLQKGKEEFGTKGKTGCTIDWRVGNALDLSWLKDGTVDVVVSGQAAHWFGDYPGAWRELHRVLRSGGTVAFWGYGDMVLPQYPSTGELIAQYMHHDKQKLGPHWEQPGRSIVSGLYDGIPWPQDGTGWDDAGRRRTRWTGQAGDEPLVLKRETGWDGLEAYCETFSALHSWREANDPEGTRRNDPVPALISDLRKATAEANGGQVPEEFELAWPLAVLCIRKQ